MALFFLIPLLTGLVGGYIFKKCTDEIGYFVGIFAALCLALSLFLAPWQVLLLLLVVVLIATKKLLQQVEKSPNQLNQSGQNQTRSFSSRNF
jgi:membrane protein implicated in regulation of membrane protease activity